MDRKGAEPCELGGMGAQTMARLGTSSVRYLPQIRNALSVFSNSNRRPKIRSASLLEQPLLHTCSKSRTRVKAHSPAYQLERHLPGREETATPGSGTTKPALRCRAHCKSRMVASRLIVGGRRPDDKAGQNTAGLSTLVQHVLVRVIIVIAHYHRHLVLAVLHQQVSAYRVCVY